MLRALALLLLLLPLASPARDPLAALAPQRERFLAALGAAERGEDGWERLAAALGDHPLAGYIDYAALSRRLPGADRAEVERFLSRHGELAVAEDLRRRFLPILDRRGDHPGLIALAAGLPGQDVECLRLKAELALGEPRPWGEILDRLWLSPKSLPTACDPLLALHRRLGLRTPERIRERLRLAAEAGEGALALHLAGLLPEAERQDALLLAEAARSPEALLARAERLPTNGDARLAVRLALLRLARRDPERAEALFERLDRRFAFSEAERGPPLAAIALASALRFDPSSEARFQRVPEAARDPELHGWRVRALLARADLSRALQALAEAPPPIAAEQRFRYLKARLLELSGEGEAALRGYRELARESHWWGFLAAARLGEPKALCPLPTPSRREAATLATARPGLLRALELWQLGRTRWADAEWRRLIDTLEAPGERAQAARLAAAVGWHRAAIAMLAGEATQGYYRLRFPLAYREAVTRAARRARLEPALLFALARAESAFDPAAQSPAGARGLVQLLPGTAEATARRLGGSAGDWHSPARNLELGALYLRSLLDRYQDRPWLALAAYNAGPGAVERWLSRSALADHPDLFLEVIPFRETREYVPRVLAFASIYRWRLEGRIPTALAWLGDSAHGSAAAEPRCEGSGEGAGAG
jgi:soluble lytic murein transglycosylase